MVAIAKQLVADRLDQAVDIYDRLAINQTLTDQRDAEIASREPVIVDAISEPLPGSRGGAPVSAAKQVEEAPALFPRNGRDSRLTLRVLDIIGDAASASSELNRDLVGAAASLLGPDVPNVRTIVTAMIERTARAETSLADATRQARSLRDELNTLRDDASRDRLTGLLNRAAMEERLSIAASSERGCAIAFVDVEALHCRVVPDVARSAHRAGRAIVGHQPLQLLARILGGFNRSLQYPDQGGCDEGSQACFGSVYAQEAAVAWTSAWMAA